MKKHLFKQFEKKHLRLMLTVFFLALLIPTSLLVYQTYDQIKWEAFHQQRQLAEELATRIDSQFLKLIEKEEARAFADYSFLNVAGEPSANFLQRSPLSNLTQDQGIPNLIGYFQIDNQGHFTTPLLPDAADNFSVYGISKAEYAQRHKQQQQVLNILSKNELIRPERSLQLSSKQPATEQAGSSVAKPIEQDKSTLASSNATSLDAGMAAPDSFGDSPAPAKSKLKEPAINTSQAGFDELARKQAPVKQAEEKEQAYSLGKVEDLRLKKEYAESARAKKKDIEQKKLTEQILKKRSYKRKETTALPEQRARSAKIQRDDQISHQAPKIEIFESEIDPFEFSILQSGQFVLYRKAWRNDHRYIQGFLVESKRFLHDMINPVYQAATLARNSDLSVAYNGDILSVISTRRQTRYLTSSEQVAGELLYRTRLSPPFSDIELIFSAHDLPAGPGGKIITWTAVVLFIILCGGFYLMYRLGARQISLARQQQDFVSAVSHELKTPLTSIRMYGEMLREGWASDDKKKSYYDFIYHESERLSRLIQNILQLARMTRNDLSIELTNITISELIDTIRSKVTSLVERNQFKLNLECDGELSAKHLNIDTDYFSQIIINLVDNAIKFSRDSEKKQIDIRCSLTGKDRISFHLRDYGPGIDRKQLKKIFTLFYRTENELTRKTVGTGIGLALVHQLTSALNGDIDVVNQHQGSEFIITFPIVD